MQNCLCLNTFGATVFAQALHIIYMHMSDMSLTTSGTWWGFILLRNSSLMLALAKSKLRKKKHVTINIFLCFLHEITEVRRVNWPQHQISDVQQVTQERSAVILMTVHLWRLLNPNLSQHVLQTQTRKGAKVQSDDAPNPFVLLEQVCVVHEKQSRADVLRNTFSVHGVIDYNRFNFLLILFILSKVKVLFLSWQSKRSGYTEAHRSVFGWASALLCLCVLECLIDEERLRRCIHMKCICLG